MWPTVILLIVSFAALRYLTPKIKPPEAAGLDQFQLPTAEDGREIPVLFGTRDINGPNIVWYGDLQTVPIKKKAGGK
jgi:hypothetical protein